jgi:hypothetical protein
MQNLAGVPECDDFIREELRKARIPEVVGPRVNHEVAYSYTGQLGPFQFRRAWSYWVAIGQMPLEFARELYADPIGKVGIRVDGHCGCPPPEDPWLEWIDADGFKLVRETERDEFERVFKEKLPEILATQRLRFSDNRERDGKAYVTCYHIDSMEGLRLFADVIRLLTTSKRCDIL